MTPIVKVAVLGLLLWLAVRGRKGSPTAPSAPGDEPFEPEPDWGEDNESGPMVGEMWGWSSLQDLPLLKKDGVLWGIYSPRNPFHLLAVVDSRVSSGGEYLVVSVSAMTGFPSRFPTK